MQTILFVCTGNTCRSPMAEAIVRHLISHGLLGDAPDLLVASAGVAAAQGSPPTPEAVAALAALGIDHHGASKPLTEEMVRKADLVLAMTSAHVETARHIGDRSDHDKIMRLDPTGDIEDPIGLDQSAYDALAAALMKIIPQRLTETVRP